LDNPVTAVVFSPNGKFLASADGSFRDFTNRQSQNTISFAQENQICIWDAASGAKVLSLRCHGASVTSLAFSPDGSRLVSGLFDGTALVWDTSKLK